MNPYNFAINMVVLMMVIGIGFIVYDGVVNSAYSQKYYTPEAWVELEEQYCQKYNMKAVSYIGQRCWIFGCVDQEKIKCVNEVNEKLIDYDDDMFCVLMLKGDIFGC